MIYLILPLQKVTFSLFVLINRKSFLQKNLNEGNGLLTICLDLLLKHNDLS